MMVDKKKYLSYFGSFASFMFFAWFYTDQYLIRGFFNHWIPEVTFFNNYGEGFSEMIVLGIIIFISSYSVVYQNREIEEAIKKEREVNNNE